MRENIRKHVFSGLGVCLIAGIILSILAPYNTGQISFIPRYIYWTGLCLAGAFGAGAFLPLCRWMNWQPGRTAEIIGQSITSSLLVTAILIAWNYYNASTVDIVEALYLFFLVWVIGIVITIFLHLAENAGGSEKAIETRRPPLFERLKPSLRNADIYALMAEDHYVRVITSKGEDLILMRLSDAIKEVGELKGLSVHRSWWVAEGGIKKVIKSDGKITIELHSGQMAPVSRSNHSRVKQSGWVS